MQQTNSQINASAATTAQMIKAPSVGEKVKYQYSKRWLRFGEIIEIKDHRARVLWNEERYSGEAKTINQLSIRTWVSVFRLMSI